MAFQGLGIEPQPTMGAALLGTLGQGLGQIGQQVQQGGAQQANLALAIRQQQQNQNMQTIQHLGLITQLPPEYRAIFTKQMEGRADPAVLDLMKKLDSKDAEFIFNHPSIQSYIKDPNALAQAPLHIQKLIPAMLQLHQYNQMQEALEDLQSDINPGGAGKGGQSAAPAPFPSQTAMPAPPGLPPGLGGGDQSTPGLGGGMPGPSMFQPQPAPQPPAGPGNAAGMQPGTGMMQPRFLPLNEGQGQGPSGPGPAASPQGAPQGLPGQPPAQAPTSSHPMDLADQMESQALALTTRAAKLDMIAAYNPSIRYAADGLRNQAKVLQDRADRHRGMTGGMTLEIPNPFTGEGNIQVRYNGYGQPVNIFGSAKQDLQMVSRVGQDGMVHQYMWDKNNPQLGFKDQGVAPQSAGDVRIAAALRAKGLTPGTPDWDIQFQNQRKMVPVGPGGDVYGGADLIGFTGSKTPPAPGVAPLGAAPAGGGAAPSPAPAGASGSGAATIIPGPNGLTATVRPAGAPAQTAQAPAPKPAAGPKPLVSRPRELPEGAVKDLASVDSLLKHIDDLKDRAKAYDTWPKMTKFASAPTIEKYTRMHWLDDEERDFQSRLDRLRLNIDRAQGGLSIFRSPKALEMLNTIIGNPWQPGLPVRLNAAGDQLKQELKDFKEKLRKSNFATPD